MPDDEDVIIFVQGRTLYWNRADRASRRRFSGLSIFQVDDLIVIHEFMNYLGLIGPDNNKQAYTLANGKIIHGSQELSQAIRYACFK